MVDAQSQATYFARPGDRQGYLLWVVRDTVVAQPFDPASTELTGSLVSVPGTEDVSSFSGTGRSSVTVSNDGTLLYQHRRLALSVGVVQTRWHRAGNGRRDRSVCRAAIVPRRR